LAWTHRRIRWWVRTHEPDRNAVAAGVVLVELAVIAWIRHRYMDTPWSSAIFQVVVRGSLVFLTGVLIGRE
jgi:hypothetical protein